MHRCSTATILAIRCMSHVIWNLLLLHTSKVFSRLNTYNSNLMFLKAMGNSHDYNTEGFSKTCRFIQDHFWTRNFISTTVEVTEANFKCLFVYFLSADIFCLKLAIKCFTFSSQKHKKSREFCCLFTESWHGGYPVKY